MKISKSTIVRTIMTALVIINFFFERCGIDVIPTDQNIVLMFVETAVEISVIIVSWWYNNSFSPNALKAQEYLEEIKESE